MTRSRKFFQALSNANDCSSVRDVFLKRMRDVTSSAKECCSAASWVLSSIKCTRSDCNIRTTGGVATTAPIVLATPSAKPSVTSFRLHNPPVVGGEKSSGISCEGLSINRLYDKV